MNQNNDSHSSASINFWKHTPSKIIRYPNGHSHTISYPSGKRLLIATNQVMDTCETPWAHATVDAAFSHLQKDSPIRVLERGFGLGISAKRILSHLLLTRGSYHVIELNTSIVKRIIQWKESSLRAITTLSTSPKPPISITISHGDAYAITKKLARKGARFDLILSDTFPLTQEEEGSNDLNDLFYLTQCIAPNGVFTFFSYSPHSPHDISPVQKQLITRYFQFYTITKVHVTPPPGYTYLYSPWTKQPITSLPVVTCWGKK